MTIPRNLTECETPRVDENSGIVTNAIGEKLEAIPATLGRQLERELRQAMGRLEDAEKELELMRLLAAEPHYINKVKEEFGPLSLWTKEGFEREVQKRIQAALPTPPASGEE